MEHSDPLERAIRTRRPRVEWTDDDFRAARERDLAERTVPVRVVVRSTLLCLVLATLLTTGKLVELAERMEFGPTRDRAVDAAEAVDRVANFLSLNRPYDAVRELRDANNGVDDGAGAVLVAAPTTTTTTTAPVVPTDSSSSTTSTTTTTTTTTLAPARAVDAADPLRVYVTGDSQATYLGQAVTTESGLPLAVEVDDRISTSLARPDYFDWLGRWREVLATGDAPEVVVLFLGANDHQDMVDAAGERLIEGSVPWQVEWRSRLDAAFELLTGDGRTAYWVTQPPMRDGGLDEGIDVINELAADVIDERGDVVTVDIWPLFGGDSGYADRIAGPDGDTITARVGDGVHLTRSAASWVADLVFAEIEERWTFS